LFLKSNALALSASIAGRRPIRRQDTDRNRRRP
jgi:hypothetical protein